ncbi:MAG TPA: MFS transporter, partial [Xanthomonadaceae bacterium]|nr:MFS transporter [Xanthomonadaceae bacterium]
LAWAMYDWANSAFAMTVMAAFFPIFLGQYWIGGSGVNATFVLGAANSAAGVVVLLLAPLLGAIADRMGARKRWLLAFALMGALMTGLLPLLERGQWLAAAVLYGLANLGFSGGNIFYDALLVGVARKDRRDFVSSLGFALGYIGGSVLFVVNIAMVERPEWFGLADSSQAVRVAFVTVAVWWAVFSAPLMLWVPEPPGLPPAKGLRAIREGLTEIATTLRRIGELRNVALFLVAYWFYIDGVDTIVRMALDFGRQLGFGTGDLIKALLLTNLVAFPATLLYGALGERIGARNGIFIALGVYAGVTFGALFIEAVWHFYVLAGVIGLVQGGIQALSRSFYSRIIPQQRSAEFFGFYNMLGKFAVVLGPFLVGWVNVLTGSARLSILSLLLFFAVGAGLLALVSEHEA